MWQSHSTYQQLIRETWQTSGRANSSDPWKLILDRLHDVRIVLKKLNADFFSGISKRVQDKELELEQVVSFLKAKYW